MTQSGFIQILKRMSRSVNFLVKDSYKFSDACKQDSIIVVTAISYIWDEFHSFKDVGWFGSSCLAS